jgi:hypothetical protein
METINGNNLSPVSYTPDFTTNDQKIEDKIAPKLLAKKLAKEFAENVNSINYGHHNNTTNDETKIKPLVKNIFSFKTLREALQLTEIDKNKTTTQLDVAEFEEKITKNQEPSLKNDESGLGFYLISSLLGENVKRSTTPMFDEINLILTNNKKEVHDSLNQNENITVELVWDGLLLSIPFFVRRFNSFSKNLPGFRSITIHDLNEMMNCNMFNFWIFTQYSMFQDGEYYDILPNGVHYSRYWMKRIIGVKTVEAIFKFCAFLHDLHLTFNELALLMALVITRDSKLKKIK